MKAYITCPVSHTQDKLALLPLIERTVKDEGFEAYVFKAGGKPKEIFQRDYQQLKSSHILIAEVSERSHGVGVEIGLSFSLGLQIILLLSKDSSVSKLVEGMPGTTIVQYGDKEELISLLIKALKKIHT